MTDTNRPNVLLIALDDMNSWLSCLGTNPDVQTPHMDRLASQGTLFTSAVCPSPVCEPSRTALLSGMRPSTTGCYTLRENLAHSPARFRGKPFPLHFRENGYHTMLGGKVDHYGQPVTVASLQAYNTSPWCEQGTDFGGQQMKMFSRHRRCDTGVHGVYSWAWHWGPLDDDQAAQLADTHVARWACHQLERDFDKPFLLAAGFHRPHVPLIAPSRFFDLYDIDRITLPDTGPDDMEGMPHFARQVALTGYQDNGGGQHKSIISAGKQREVVQAYLACISYADECIGQVLSALENSKYAENTIVVVLSDNGYGLGEHYHWKKWSMFESGSRVPLIVKAPGMPAGQACSAGVDFCDIYPTLVDLCGLEAPDHLDGQTLRPLLSGEKEDRDQPGITSFGPGNHSLRTSRYRYTRYADGSEELYDIQADPKEWNNLAQSPAHVKVREALAPYFPANPAPSVACVPPAGGPFRLNKHDSVWFRAVQAGFDHTRIRLRARVRARGDGPIIHHGGFFGRYGLYVKDGRVGLGIASVREPLRWDQLEPWEANVEADAPLRSEWVELEGVIEADGAMRLLVDGEVAATGQAEGALAVYPSGILEIGKYTNSAYPNVGGYGHCKDFPGEIEDVRIDYGDLV